jgi:hypothetical protein
VLTRPGFVRAAPTHPGTSRSRLPSAPPPCCDRVSGEGLSPPLETTAPHGARIRDVTYDEDRSQIRAGTGPHVTAALRNPAIGALRVAAVTNIAAANRFYSRDSTRFLALLGIT